MPKNKGHNRGRSTSLTPTATAAIQNPRDQKPVRQQLTGQLVSFEHYSGILPKPDMLERYEALLPGTTDRYLKLAEKQSSHRQVMEGRSLLIHGATQLLGTLFAGAALLGGIGGGVWLISTGKSLEGLVALVGAISSAIGVYRWGQSAQAKDREAKSRATQG